MFDADFVVQADRNFNDMHVVYVYFFVVISCACVALCLEKSASFFLIYLD